MRDDYEIDNTCERLIGLAVCCRNAPPGRGSHAVLRQLLFCAGAAHPLSDTIAPWVGTTAHFPPARVGLLASKLLNQLALGGRVEMPACGQERQPGPRPSQKAAPAIHVPRAAARWCWSRKSCCPRAES